MVDVYNLPNELLAVILSKLPIKDLFCCTVVCRRWCEAVLRGFDVQHQEMPWYIMETSADGDADHFFSPRKGKQCKISRSFSRIQGGKIIGSFYGWLIITNHAEVQLINFISRVCIDLPSIPATLATDRDITDWDITKGMLCSVPSHDRDQVVILICECVEFDGDDYILFARATDERWMTICLDGVSIYDAIFYRDKLYAAVKLEGGGENVMVTFDLIAPHLRTPLRAFPHALNYTARLFFVSVPSGDLWLAQEEFAAEYKIWKVDAEESLIISMNTLGTCALFLGNGCSHCINSLSFPEIKPDAIYFFDTDGIGIYNMKGGRTDTLTVKNYPFSKNRVLLEIWFTPIPAQVDLI